MTLNIWGGVPIPISPKYCAFITSVRIMSVFPEIIFINFIETFKKAINYENNIKDKGSFNFIKMSQYLNISIWPKSQKACLRTEQQHFSSFMFSLFFDPLFSEWTMILDYGLNLFFRIYFYFFLSNTLFHVKIIKFLISNF